MKVFVDVFAVRLVLMVPSKKFVNQIHVLLILRVLYLCPVSMIAATAATQFTSALQASKCPATMMPNRQSQNCMTPILRWKHILTASLYTTLGLLAVFL
jgi:hypothetical protein